MVEPVAFLSDTLFYCVVRKFASLDDMMLADLFVVNDFSNAIINNVLRLLRNPKFDPKRVTLGSDRAVHNAIHRHSSASTEFEAVLLPGFGAAGLGVTCYKRDARAVVEMILTSKLHKDNISYAGPITDSNEYGDMRTGSWWQATDLAMPMVQNAAGELEKATLCPIIVSSDSTNLSFSGTKSAHNVFMTLGLLDSTSRRRVDGCVFF
jgi:hypothetical protein